MHVAGNLFMRHRLSLVNMLFRRAHGIVGVGLLLVLLVHTEAASSLGTEALPRTAQSIPRSTHRKRFPPWNPSPQIDVDGFLSDSYQRLPGEWEEEVRLRTSFNTDLPCYIRQVPGDGNCLFHSISLCLYHAENGTHWNIQSQEALDDLYRHSQLLRAQAVSCLRSHSKKLFLQGRESLRAHELVHAAALQYGLTPEEYCESMQQDCVWGGGPEIVALCNILQRPIHVYELATNHGSDDTDDEEEIEENQLRGMGRSARSRASSSAPTFLLRRMACFGSPRFDKRSPLHILSADSRFPDLQPGSQLTTGNHFLAVFPVTELRKRPRKLLRGGSFRLLEDDDECDGEYDAPLEVSAKSTWSLRLKTALLRLLSYW